MRIFIAGATGAIGRRLVPALIGRGHRVTGMTRSRAGADALEELGAEPVVADALDREQTLRAVAQASPEVVVHQMTALAEARDLRNFDRTFAATNRLRTVGTDNLMAGARAAGARQFVAQSYGNWVYRPGGPEAKSEEDPFDPSPPLSQRRTLDAIIHLERVVRAEGELAGVVLRYGNFYGPGTALARDGEMTELVRRRRLPVIGKGGGIWSFIHVDDAASATLAAIDSSARGTYNVVDDEPAPVAEWLPELARIVGARTPWRVPEWVGRLAAGEAAVSMMTRVSGASNARIKRELGWSPAWTSWREGLRHELATPTSGGR
ncbi:MAG TPA: NAD(P)-dependent oxidoreductase [Gemmatimonadales bacterium]|nr:NAD(P)-dependent oxidoreductase [Gemmatimonadales bacterium]